MQKHTVLIVDDEKSVRESIKMVLEEKYRVITAVNGQEALVKFKQEDVDLVLLDIRMPGMSGIAVLEELEKLDHTIEVIMVTATTAVDVAVESMHKGARNYLTKPFDIDELTALVSKLLRNKERRTSQFQRTELPYVPLFLKAGSMALVNSQVQEAVLSKKPVIIEGDNGTEKEDVAYTIHIQSRQSKFLVIHCCHKSMFSAQLTKLEEELFEQPQDEFLAEVDQIKPGMTIFLSRIDLLDALEQGELLAYFQNFIKSEPDFFRRVRLISTVEEDLINKVNYGDFDEELLHYINGDCITLPSLIQRRNDLSGIIQYYLDYFNRQHGKKIIFSPSILQLLCQYRWPGNTIELMNLLHRLVLRQSHNQTKLESFPLYILANSGSDGHRGDVSMDSFLREFEANYIKKAIKDFPDLKTLSKKLGVPLEKLEKQFVSTVGNTSQ
ncbi:sigma-54-dependent transcriptional regulator [Candidatus Margulisiibacteriota bacterium]